MKRFHLNMTVSDLDQSIAFYSALFGIEPTVAKPDYAKWLVDDPQLNFSITSRGAQAGINHVGLQFDAGTELGEARERLNDLGSSTFDQESTACCYARSDKAWARDPDGVSWESFVTHEQIESYGEDVAEAAPVADPKAPCCGRSASI